MALKILSPAAFGLHLLKVTQESGFGDGVALSCAPHPFDKEHEKGDEAAFSEDAIENIELELPDDE